MQLFLYFQTSDETMCFNVLALMSTSGDLFICALGTDLNLFAPPHPEARQINYEEADAEMASLSSIIKNIQTQDPAQISDIGGDDLNISVEILPNLEHCYHHTMVSDEDGIPMAKITIELRASTPLNRIRIGIDVAEPLVVTRTSFILNSLSMFYSKCF